MNAASLPSTPHKRVDVSPEAAAVALTAADTVLCICTFRRPAGLARLLEHLPTLESNTGLHVIVIDNDAAGEGAQVVQSLRADYPFQVDTHIAATPGISQARNRAVQAGLALNRPVLAFLDDDEWPESQWLTQALQVMQHYDADAVGGPTRSVFPGNTPPPGLDLRYYGADLHLADGAACQLQAAGNVVVRSQALRRLPEPWFSAAFSHSGGEDLAFFTRLAQNGARMHWAAQAVVHEEVPEHRLTRSWLRARVMTIANSRVRVMQQLEPGWRPTCVRVVKTLGLAPAALLASLAGVFHAGWRVRAQEMRWRCLGKLGAHLNRTLVRDEAQS